MGLDPSDVLLTGQVAVVTGGGSGIGRGIANGLTAFGARVAIWERNEDTSEEAAAEVGGVSCAIDVRDPDQVDDALARTLAELGPVSILVNNAGGVFRSPLLETSPNGWDALLRSNLGHVLLCTQRVARTMVDARTAGSIINVTSIEGSRAAPGYAAYAAAKAGVINLTKTAALELAPHGIRVNAIAPGLTDTAQPRYGHSDEELAEMGKAIPLGRMGQPDDIADVALFLASDEARFITGQTVHVNGGSYMG